MKKKSAMRRGLFAALIVLMLTGTCSTGFAATTFSDVNGHWAANSINYGVARGFINGYTDGTFKPDYPVTRAEFSKMLNIAFGISNTQATSFRDVPSTAWYATEVKKAVAAGYINGYEDNTFRPNNNITRQEAAVMIASVIPAAGTTPSLSGLIDNASIADWARDAVVKVYAKGYMKGDTNNMFNPRKSLSRAEAATILSNIITKETIVSGDTVISKNGTEITDTIYANDLTISKSLGSGSVELRDSTVLGTMNVLGGGSGFVELYITNVNNMNVAKTTGDVRVLLSGDSTVKDAIIENGCTLEHKSLRGSGFQNIYFNGADLDTQEVDLIGSFNQLYINIASTINSTDGTISNVTVKKDAYGDTVKLGGTYTNVTLETKTVFELLTGKISTFTINSGASSSTVKMNSKTSITTAVVNAAKTAFTGTGLIARLEANANDITYETKPTRIVTAGSVTREPVQSADISAPSPTFSPADSATNILANTKITITFDEPIYLSNGNSVSTSSLSNIIELRKGSSTGTEVPYSASINSAKTVITVTPDDILTNNTSYYIIIPSRAIEDELGNENSKITSVFKTGTTDVAPPVPTFTPANGAINVAVDSDITIVFNESLYNSSGSLLAANTNLTTTSLILKKGGSSGTNIPFTATYSGSSAKTITITPIDPLPAGTYYVAIIANKFEDAAGNSIPLTSSTFSTVGEVFPISIAPIGGITVPATGATPVTSATATSQYTAAVSWSPNPATFAASTTYTATITITPKTGFTLTGVPANFFTVAGAISDTNLANSGVVTAIFPATAAPVISLSHNVSGNTKVFSPLPVDYEPGTQDAAMLVTVAASGANTNVQAVLSGTNAASFELTETIDSLLDSQTGTFTIRAKDGLTVGTHTATVTVTSSEFTSGTSFTVTQVIKPIALAHNVSGSAKIFTPLIENYVSGTQGTLTVTITATGSNTNIQAVLSGTNADSFELTENIDDLAHSETDIFTVKAKDGLTAGTYTATVTVTSSEFVSGVSFTITQEITVEPAE